MIKYKLRYLLIISIFSISDISFLFVGCNATEHTSITNLPSDDSNNTSSFESVPPDDLIKFPSKNTPTDTGLICIPENTTFNLYEMRKDDIRFRYLTHPRFSLEYPEIFNLIDENMATEWLFTYDKSLTMFTVPQTGFTMSNLSIIIQKPGTFGFDNAIERIQHIQDYVLNPTDIIEFGEKKVAQIHAEYLKAFSTNYPSTFLKFQRSYRAVVFEYADLIWCISLEWYYDEVEQPQIQMYFDHVIETFKILD